TPLAEAVLTAGGQLATGLDMLLHQAFGQVEQFTGRPAPREEMRAALREATGGVHELPLGRRRWRRVRWAEQAGAVKAGRERLDGRPLAEARPPHGRSPQANSAAYSVHFSSTTSRQPPVRVAGDMWEAE